MNGDIYVKNRRGINYKGFPVKLDSDLTNKINRVNHNQYKNLINLNQITTNKKNILKKLFYNMLFLND